MGLLYCVTLLRGVCEVPRDTANVPERRDKMGAAGAIRAVKNETQT